ncbi:hypothetical protein LMG24238_07128 [Paraburkholderia sediminicola]|uniref:Conserved hypothetical protein CHP02391 domain-containing protein n=1 Tax=Paraburkholderia sediminicola TaxID=458836 RepID=A0A6J5CRG0_9BURK|nr:TIGR02391 family protein [Paraburkholderia sediminicola]CAB3743800.1 hypothetical protein LMG24238_07128 [Paraburkholderia sediminicola]
MHAHVLPFCRSELVADNYFHDFHAVLEATKSVAAKIREKTGLVDDGGASVDRVLGGNPPMLAINPLADESDFSEQRGFGNLVKGMFGMFRNTASLVHRRLDVATTPARLWAGRGALPGLKVKKRCSEISKADVFRFQVFLDP